MLSVEHIFKTYEKEPLLVDVSLDINEGETVCLLGPSGSGKSTLLRIITGLENPEQGQVLWNGQDITQVPTHLRQFSLMFQSFALFPHLTVAQNVAFGIRMQKLPQAEIDMQVDKSLALINMERFAQRKVTELSGGEQQRVALARALATHPRLLMLDEPLGALDRSLKEQLGMELRQILKETHIPVIYVTHDQQEAFTIADRLMILHDGTIQQADTPENIYAQPVNAWIAAFLGLGTLFDIQAFHPQEQIVVTDLGSFPTKSIHIPAGQEKNYQLLLRSSEVNVSDAHVHSNFAISAIVVDCRFRGIFYSLSLRIPTGQRIETQSLHPHAIGKAVKLTFPLDALVLLPRKLTDIIKKVPE